MAHQDKLIYFNARGRAEQTRMLFAVAGKPFIDERVNIEDWPSIKADQPLGQLPVLATEDGLICQSSVIDRHVAKKLGLMGSGLWEETLHDMVLETSAEMFKEVAEKIAGWKIFKKAPEPENADKILEEVKNNLLKKYAFIQSLAEKRGKRFIVTETIGLADVCLYSGLDFLTAIYSDAMQLTPWIKEFSSKFESNENVKNYLSSRPAN